MCEIKEYKKYTYWLEEKEFYVYQINQINEETIKTQKAIREKQNKEVAAKVYRKL